MNVNNVVLQGRLGKDAHISENRNGTTRAFFVLANGRKYRNSDGDLVEDTSWIPVVYQGKGAAAIAEYLVKGQHVTVTGRINTYETEKDGERIRNFEVMTFDVQLSPRSNGGGNGESNGGGNGGGGGSRSSGNSRSRGKAEEFDSEDVPF